MRRGSPDGGLPEGHVDRIITVALQIIDDEGVEALSMRSLATHLNASTATVYRHFSNRAGLLAAVTDRVLREIDAESESLRAGTWQQGCHRIATDYFAALKRHSNVVPLLADHMPAGLNSAAVREGWLSLMLDNGFSLELAARSGAAVAHYVEGLAIQLVGQRVTAGLDEAQMAVAIRSLDATKFPITVAAIHAGAIPVPLEDEFSFGLDLILDGLGQLREGARS